MTEQTSILNAEQMAQQLGLSQDRVLQILHESAAEGNPIGRRLSPTGPFVLDAKADTSRLRAWIETHRPGRPKAAPA